MLMLSPIMRTFLRPSVTSAAGGVPQLVSPGAGAGGGGGDVCAAQPRSESVHNVPVVRAINIAGVMIDAATAAGRTGHCSCLKRSA